MDRNKVIIGGLIVIALLFFLGLGTGFVLNTEEEPDPSDYRPSGWIKVMDSLLAPFGPSLDLDRLKPQAHCRSLGKTVYILNKRSPTCDINIEAADDYQKATLNLTGSEGAQVRVAYEPSDGEEPMTKTLPTDDIRLAVLQEGGSLGLQCKNCGEGDGLTVRVEFK